MRAPSILPSVVVIAGLDPMGGAGLLADVAVIRSAGLHACGVVTASTIQGGNQAAAIGEIIAPRVIAAQLARLTRVRAQKAAIAAIKIGLVPNVATATTIAGWLKTVPNVPVVWDPVLGASSGGALVKGSVAAIAKILAPALRQKTRRDRAVITPNFAEALALAKGLGIAVARDISHGELAPKLATVLGTAVLVKGGHAPFGDRVQDALAVGKELYVIEKDYVPGGTDVRGTGCALSSLIGSYLAHSMDLVTACCDASHALTDSLLGAV